MSEYKATIGLEIHAELKTKTKMFCDSKNDPEEEKPNMNTCPVCMAHPGTLPVINKAAVKHVLRVGKALKGNIADFTEFDRKNYFYPDIPKGYQISQYKYPLVSGGELAGVEITRVHLEEDTATSKHDKGDHSLVDFNRAGVPLMELVTEPVVRDAEQAMMFAKELQLLLRYLGAGDANMEKGEMRVEANISVSKTDTFGTKVEVKNLNSFKIVAKAIEYEIERQIKEIESGGEIVQETRGWDEAKQKTFSQRIKESSDDYRYFPDPDLPKLKISEIEEFQNLELPELPWEKRERYRKEFGIKDEDIESFIIDEHLAKYFEDVISVFNGDKNLIKLASNYITSDLVGLTKAGFPHPDHSQLAELVLMVSKNEISSRGAKEILKILVEDGGNARDIAEEKGLFQKSDEGEIKKIVEQIISENQSAADEYRAGKEASLKFLIGQGMRATKGSANPQVLEKIFVEVLSK
ncbi:Asp-tRNA(Asn)/Glu-tRNA(Gln) amidotransferase subunit GatB [Patescibacteria group bacterium]